jgi:O-antigen ligase
MIDRILGALLALFFLSGRYSLAGDERTADETMLYDVRVWSLFALVGIALTYSPPRSDIPRRTKHVSTTLAPTLALLLPLYVALSHFWSVDSDLSTMKMLEALILGAACLCFVPMIKAGRGPAVRHWFWISIVLATGLMCLNGCASVGSARLSVLGGGPNTFGRNMGLLCLGALYLQRRGSALIAWRWYPLMALALVMVLLSGSRGALLATSVGAITYLLIDTRFRRRNVLAIGCFAILTHFIMLSTGIGEQATQMFETRILNQTLARQDMSGREELFAAAYELGLESPWFGHGLAGFPAITGRNYPHNIALELFCETGIVGVLLFVGLLIAALIFVVGQRQHCDPVIWGAFGLMLASAMFSGDFFDSRGVFLMTMLGSQEVVALRSAGSQARPRAAAQRGHIPMPAPSPGDGAVFPA